MKKTIISILFLSFTLLLSAQVKFSLSLLEDQETYLVSLVSEKDIPAPLNIASNIQVVLKIPNDEPFLAGDIKSQIPGIDWMENAFAKQSNDGDTYGLCAFVMVQGMTNAIQFAAEEEVPLFTFKNLESGCVGSLSLPDNTSPEVTKALGRHLNFTQNITLLATRGNAYSGIINEVADCNSLSTSVTENELGIQLKAYPIPTKDVLTIKWNNPISFEQLQIDILGANGQLVQTLPLDPSIGEKQLQLMVSDYPTGLYNFLIKNETGQFQQHRFIVVE